jgi:hypothetical protein
MEMEMRRMIKAISLLLTCLFFSSVCPETASDNSKLSFEESYNSILKKMLVGVGVSDEINRYIESRAILFQYENVRYETIKQNSEIVTLEFLQFLTSRKDGRLPVSAEHLYLSIYLEMKTFYENGRHIDFLPSHEIVFYKLMQQHGIDQLYSEVLNGNPLWLKINTSRELSYRVRPDFEGRWMTSFFGDSPVDFMNSLIDPEIGLSGFSFFKPLEKYLIIQYNPKNRDAVEFLNKLEKESGVVVKKEPTTAVFTFKLFLVANKAFAREIYQKYYGIPDVKK